MRLFGWIGWQVGEGVSCWDNGWCCLETWPRPREKSDVISFFGVIVVVVCEKKDKAVKETFDMTWHNPCRCCFIE